MNNNKYCGQMINGASIPRPQGPHGPSFAWQSLIGFYQFNIRVKLWLTGSSQGINENNDIQNNIFITWAPMQECNLSK